MIKKYVKEKPNDVILKQMYKILIENLFITYPEFLNEKNKHDNKENYNSWISMVKNAKDYYVITFTEKNKVLGFLNYCIINNELWLSEIQISRLKRNDGILKQMIKEFVNIESNKHFKYVIAHIADNNRLSRDVFTHIGFKNIGNSLYQIDLKELASWSNS